MPLSLVVAKTSILFLFSHLALAQMYFVGPEATMMARKYVSKEKINLSIERARQEVGNIADQKQAIVGLNKKMVSEVDKANDRKTYIRFGERLVGVASGALFTTPAGAIVGAGIMAKADGIFNELYKSNSFNIKRAARLGLENIKRHRSLSLKEISHLSPEELRKVVQTHLPKELKISDFPEDARPTAIDFMVDGTRAILDDLLKRQEGINQSLSVDLGALRKDLLEKARIFNSALKDVEDKISKASDKLAKQNKQVNKRLDEIDRSVKNHKDAQDINTKKINELSNILFDQLSGEDQKEMLNKGFFDNDERKKDLEEKADQKALVENARYYSGQVAGFSQAFSEAVDLWVKDGKKKKLYKDISFYVGSAANITSAVLNKDYASAVLHGVRIFSKNKLDASAMRHREVMQGIDKIIEYQQILMKGQLMLSEQIDRLEHIMVAHFEKMEGNLAFDITHNRQYLMDIRESVKALLGEDANKCSKFLNARYQYGFDREKQAFPSTPYFQRHFYARREWLRECFDGLSNIFTFEGIARPKPHQLLLLDTDFGQIYTRLNKTTFDKLPKYLKVLNLEKNNVYFPLVTLLEELRSVDSDEFTARFAQLAYPSNTYEDSDKMAKELRELVGKKSLEVGERSTIRGIMDYRMNPYLVLDYAQDFLEVLPYLDLVEDLSENNFKMLSLEDIFHSQESASSVNEILKNENLKGGGRYLENSNGTMIIGLIKQILETAKITLLQQTLLSGEPLFDYLAEKHINSTLEESVLRDISEILISSPLLAENFLSYHIYNGIFRPESTPEENQKRYVIFKGLMDMSEKKNRIKSEYNVTMRGLFPKSKIYIHHIGGEGWMWRARNSTDPTKLMWQKIPSLERIMSHHIRQPQTVKSLQELIARLEHVLGQRLLLQNGSEEEIKHFHNLMLIYQQ